MSETILYKILGSGNLREYATFSNAYLGAYYVWTQMAKVYLKLDFGEILLDRRQRERLSQLLQDPACPRDERIVLATSFDRAVVRRDELPEVIAAYRTFAARYGGETTLGAQADALARVEREPTCWGVCWNQTSVNYDMWRVPKRNGDNRLYNLRRDTGHWFVFEDVCAP